MFWRARLELRPQLSTQLHTISLTLFNRRLTTVALTLQISCAFAVRTLRDHLHACRIISNFKHGLAQSKAAVYHAGPATKS